MSITEEMEECGERYALEFGEPFAVGVARCVCDGVDLNEWQDADDVQRSFAVKHLRKILGAGLEQWREENHAKMGELVALDLMGVTDERDQEDLRDMREALDVLQRASDAVIAERVIIRDDNNEVIHAMIGRLVAHISTQRDGRPRWMELELYRLSNGAYTLREIGQTNRTNEVQLNTFTDYPDEQALIDDRGHDLHSRMLYSQAMIYTVEI